ncbi:MAG: 3-dehydroquinate synthase II family protein [Desulfovibrionaceae bacterium]
MPSLLFKSVPLCKQDVTLALESGVDGIIVPREQVAQVASLARCQVWADEDVPTVTLNAKEDEEHALALLNNGQQVVLARGWEIIPVENLLAQHANVSVEVASLEEARLAAGILECGVACIVMLPAGLAELKSTVAEIRRAQSRYTLEPAVITKIQHVGLGHRVCVDTLSLFQKGQGMLVGNSSAFTFLVHAETEHNEYVAARPFRVNAGAVHAYVQLPADKTSYLGELRAGQEVLHVCADGSTSLVTVGRVKVEVRPMLLIEARILHGDGHNEDDICGSIFLQNAETIRLTSPEGSPLSVVSLREGDTVLCHTDKAGRHFGIRIAEDIREL